MQNDLFHRGRRVGRPRRIHIGGCTSLSRKPARWLQGPAGFYHGVTVQLVSLDGNRITTDTVDPARLVWFRIRVAFLSSTETDYIGHRDIVTMLGDVYYHVFCNALADADSKSYKFTTGDKELFSQKVAELVATYSV